MPLRAPIRLRARSSRPPLPPRRVASPQREAGKHYDAETALFLDAEGLVAPDGKYAREQRECDEHQRQQQHKHHYHPQERAVAEPGHESLIYEVHSHNSVESVELLERDGIARIRQYGDEHIHKGHGQHRRESRDADCQPIAEFPVLESNTDIRKQHYSASHSHDDDDVFPENVVNLAKRGEKSVFGIFLHSVDEEEYAEHYNHARKREQPYLHFLFFAERSVHKISPLQM